MLTLQDLGIYCNDEEIQYSKPKSQVSGDDSSSLLDRDFRWILQTDGRKTKWVEKLYTINFIIWGKTEAIELFDICWFF